MLVTEILEETEGVKDGYRLEIEKMRQMKQPVILFGAGSTREFHLQYFHQLGIKPTAFCDNSLDKIGENVGELEILSFDQIRQSYPDAYYYITTQLFYKEVRKQILDAGCRQDQISEYDIIFQLQWEENGMEYYRKHEDEIEWLYHALADDESRKVLRNRLLFLQTRNRKYMLEVRRKKQYFEEELIDFSKVHCFVDLGMYTGDTISAFLNVSDGQYRQIYGFEPDRQLYQTAKDDLKAQAGIEFVPMATSDYDGQAKVSQSLGVMQTIEDEGVYSASVSDENTFAVCRLDTYFQTKQERIDMIKMDIEGAELATLKGAKERILSDRPVLAVCVYHKQEDIFKIPHFCKELIPEYEIYLRHYSDNQTETVCYMIPKENPDAV